MKKNLLRCSYALLHALFMLFLLFCWTNADITLTSEGTLLKIESTLKRISPLRHLHPYPYSADDLLLVDVAGDKIVQMDSLQAKMILITDPHLLNAVMQQFRQTGGYRFILCDLAFDLPTPYDDSLLNTLQSIPSAGFALQQGYSANPHIRPLEALPGGVVHYELTGSWWKFSDELVKFELVNGNGEKSLPLYMAEQVHGAAVTGKGMYSIDNMTFDAPVRLEDLRKDNGTSRIYSLSDCKTLMQFSSPAELEALVKNKFILIGNFSADLHKTAFGYMPGVLILFNIFATLTDGTNVVTAGWVIFLLLAFTIVSWLTFFRRGSPRFIHQAKDVAEILFGEIGGSLLLNWLALWFISIISYFIFNKSTQVIALTFYLSFVDYLRYLWLEKATFFENNNKGFRYWLKFIFKIKRSS